MSNELTIVEQQTLELFNNDKGLADIKKIYGENLTDNEFTTFVQMGKSLCLNPFLREIWAVKYDKGKAAQIFIGRDGYRSKAIKHPDYDFHVFDAVYENDNFHYDVRDGYPTHSYTVKNRGKLIGAYALAKRKSGSRPFYIFVKFDEYNINQSVWKSKPETMIKKVAECQALRGAFQDMFGGTYSEDEYNPDFKDHKKDRQTADLIEELKEASGVTVEGESAVEVEETGELVTEQQIKFLEKMIETKGLTDERFNKALDYYSVEAIDKLTQAQATKFIEQLSKMDNK